MNDSSGPEQGVGDSSGNISDDIVLHVDKEPISLEDSYLTQVMETEQLRFMMEEAKHQFLTMKIRTEFTERTITGQHEHASSLEEAVESITGTVSTHWVELVPTMPFQDSSKPEYKQKKRAKEDTWYKLA